MAAKCMQVVFTLSIQGITVMPSSKSSNSPSRRLVLGTLAALPVISVPLVAGMQPATAQAPLPTGAGFSFIAYGDSRPMMNIPSKYGRPEVTKLLAESFGILMSEKVAEEIVQKNVKMTFDPATKELTQLVMPFVTKSEVMTLKVHKGWVTEASVEDVKLLPGVPRTMFRLPAASGWRARS